MGKEFYKWIPAAVISLALACIPSFSLGDQKDQKDNGVAIVNGTIITQDHFNRELARFEQSLAARGQSYDKESMPSIRKQIIENIIGAELLYEQSQKSNIMVDEKEINEKWEKLKTQFNGEDEVRDALKKMDLSESIVKTQLRQGLAIQKLIDKEFAKKISIPDSDIKEYYDKNPEKFNLPEQVKASHILITFENNAEESQKKAAMEEIKKIQNRIKSGEDFAALAKEYSKCPSSEKGGDLGYFRRGQMVPPFEEAAFVLKTGDVSDIVETKYGYHIIKVTDRMESSTLGFDAVKVRLRDFLKSERVGADVGKYVAELRAKADVKIFMDVNP